MAAPDLAQIIKDMDMTPAEVVREARVNPVTLAAAIAGTVPDRNIQLKLEAVLDQPIWSTPGEFTERRKLRDFLGCEPLLLNTAQLLARARQLGVDRVPSKAIAAKGKLIDAIAAFVQGTSFEPNGRLWRCLKCGHIFEPKKVPELCPSCFGLKFCRVGG